MVGVVRTKLKRVKVRRIGVAQPSVMMKLSIVIAFPLLEALKLVTGPARRGTKVALLYEVPVG